jgi:hypothetical protein
MHSHHRKWSLGIANTATLEGSSATSALQAFHLRNRMQRNTAFWMQFHPLSTPSLLFCHCDHTSVLTMQFRGLLFFGGVDGNNMGA